GEPSLHGSSPRDPSSRPSTLIAESPRHLPDPFPTRVRVPQRYRAGDRERPPSTRPWDGPHGRTPAVTPRPRAARIPAHGAGGARTPRGAGPPAGGGPGPPAGGCGGPAHAGRDRRPASRMSSSRAEAAACWAASGRDGAAVAITRRTSETETSGRSAPAARARSTSRPTTY